ncbi:hypothetical protein IFVP203_C170024 [Vibrio parahaemolyticus]
MRLAVKMSSLTVDSPFWLIYGLLYPDLNVTLLRCLTQSLHKAEGNSSHT